MTTNYQFRQSEPPTPRLWGHLAAILFIIAAIGGCNRAMGQAGDPKWFFRGAGAIDQTGYVTKVNSSLYAINSSGNFALLAQSNFANASHTHPASAITDFNSVGDARWSLLGHVHAASDITSGVFNHARLGTGGGGSTKFLREDGTWQTLPSGVTDHGALTGLSDDDHPQYHNDARGDARYSLLAHTHAFADLTSKPTTVAGYGITDYNSLGDARWSMLGHTHVSADITDASTGGNDVADNGLLAKYNTEGQLHGSVVNSSTPAVWGSSAGSGYAGLFNGGNGTVRLGTPVAPIEVNGSGLVMDATRINAGTVVHIGGLTGTGLDISEAGVLSWTSGTGASGTRTSLGLVIGTNVQAYDADLTTYAGITPSANVQTLLGSANYAAFRTSLSLGNVENTALSTWTGSTNITTLGTITSGTWTGDKIGIANGGTDASTASSARDNLGLKIGTDVQAADAELTALASVSSSADRVPYFTGAGTADVTAFGSLGRTLVGGVSTSAMRSTLGLGTISTQDANNVTISGGSVTGITDLTVADGGTGSSTASGARTNLGLVIGTDVEAKDADLTTIAGLSPSNDDFLQRKAGAWTNRSVAQAKIDLGLSGNNTGDQTITLTGAVTGSGTGSFATSYGDGEISSIAGLTSAADKVPQYTGSGTAQLVDLKLGVEAAYTGTITWTAGAAPSSTANLRQFYTRIGNLVTWQISLTYATAGTTVTNVLLTFPTEFPTPDIPTGFTGASVHLYNCDITRLYTTPSGSLSNATGFMIDRNAADNGFEIRGSAFASGSYRTFIFSGTYFTQ